jgi:hypothetical protein
MKRAIALTLALLVALPWAALPLGAGAPCAPAGKEAMASCCTTSGSAPESSLLPGCCRFTPRSEAAPIQASGVSPAPKPLQSPETPAAVVTCAALEFLRGSFASVVLTPSPPSIHAPPTETTHLLI